jgi:hypothetical protein
MFELPLFLRILQGTLPYQKVANEIFTERKTRARHEVLMLFSLCSVSAEDGKATFH